MDLATPGAVHEVVAGTGSSGAAVGGGDRAVDRQDGGGEVVHPA
jgi:hypothetical protein